MSFERPLSAATGGWVGFLLPIPCPLTFHSMPIGDSCPLPFPSMHCEALCCRPWGVVHEVPSFGTLMRWSCCFWCSSLARACQGDLYDFSSLPLWWVTESERKTRVSHPMAAGKIGGARDGCVTGHLSHGASFRRRGSASTSVWRASLLPMRQRRRIRRMTHAVGRLRPRLRSYCTCRCR